MIGAVFVFSRATMEVCTVIGFSRFLNAKFQNFILGGSANNRDT